MCVSLPLCVRLNVCMKTEEEEGEEDILKVHRKKREMKRERERETKTETKREREKDE